MTSNTPTRRQFIADSTTVAAGALLARASIAHAQESLETAPEFRTDTANDLDRIWLGQELWANPMQDWRMKGGRIDRQEMVERSQPEGTGTLLASEHQRTARYPISWTRALSA